MKKLIILFIIFSINNINAQNNEIHVQNLNGTSLDLNKL